MKGFTQKYNLSKLIYFELFDDINLAIGCEKQIKGYSRAKKVALINKFNKNWDELHYNQQKRMIYLTCIGSKGFTQSAAKAKIYNRLNFVYGG